jgi:hypothetical protein
MKKILMMLLLCATCGLAKAQFTNTKWNGALAVPDMVNVTLDFKKGVVDIILAENGETVETMSYTVSADTLILKKVSGQSSCGVNSVAKVKFSITDNKLSIINLSDDCPLRAGSWTQEPFIKAKD